MKFKEKTFKEVVELNELYIFETNEKNETVLAIQSATYQGLKTVAVQSQHPLILKDPRCSILSDFVSGAIFKLNGLEFTLVLKEERTTAGTEKYFEVKLI